MLMQGLCCIRDVEGGLRFLRRAALQDEPNSMLQYAQVLDDGVLLQRSSSAAAFFLNRAMAAVQEAGDGSLDHLKVIQTSPSHPPTSTWFHPFFRSSSVAPSCRSCGSARILLKFFSKHGCRPSRRELMQETAARCLHLQDASCTVGACRATSC